MVSNNRLNIGVIGIRGAWSTESLSQQLHRKKAGGTVIELNELQCDLERVQIHHPQLNLEEFDGFIIKKMGRTYSPHMLDQLELLELLERRGIRFFSSPGSIRKMISRLSCTICLRDANIPMPMTYITEQLDDAVNWITNNGPAILKPLYSTKARGMTLLHDEAEARRVLSNFLCTGEKIIYLQKKLDLSGTDYSLVFLAGRYIGAYARVGDGSSWHTTTEEGGAYKPFTPPDEMIELAARAQQPFGLDFTCVDIADSRECGHVVFEVSAFGGYRGLFDSCGVDAANLLTDHVIKSLRK